MRSALVASALLISLGASSAALADGLASYGLPHCNENEVVWVENEVSTFPDARPPEIREVYVCNFPESPKQAAEDVAKMNDKLAYTASLGPFPGGATQRAVTRFEPLPQPQDQAAQGGVFASLWAALSR